MTHPQTSDEQLAKLFHETYERLAPSFTYQTRKASAVPWEEVPANNKGLMISVAHEVNAHFQAHDDQLYEVLVAGQKHCYDCVHEEISNPDVVPYIPLHHIKTVMKKGK